MAALTTVEGVQYNFDPGAVAAVSDHDPATGEGVTCVHGLLGTYLKIAESAPAFLARLQITANFAPLTGPNGISVWLNGSSVAAIREKVAGDAPNANSVAYTSSITQEFEESLNEVAAALRAHGGKI